MGVAALAAILGLLLLGSMAPSRVAAASTTGTLRGTVTNALRPTPGFVVIARAIDAQDGSTAASVRVRSNGSYRLRVPPTVYLVVVDKAGPRTAPVTGFGRLALVRAGETGSVPPIAPGSATAARTTSSVSSAFGPGSSTRATTLAASRPAIAVRYLTAIGPDTHLGRGISAMLVTDLFGSRCYILVEWEQRNLILNEIRFQQSRWVDPSTRVAPRLIQPRYFVEGSLATGTARSSWNVRVRERATGRIIASDSGSAANLVAAAPGIGQRLKKRIDEELCGFPARFSGTFTGENRTAARNSYSGTISFVRDRSQAAVVSYRLESVSWTHRMTSLPTSPCQVNANTQASAQAGATTNGVLVIQKQRTAKGYGYAMTAGFASTKQLSITFVCNGVPSQQPWIPGGALNSGPPPSPLGGAGTFTDAKTIKGRYESTGTASTYTWNLRGSG